MSSSIRPLRSANGHRKRDHPPGRSSDWSRLVAIGRDWTTRFPAVFLERCAALFMCEGKHAYITLQDSCVRPFTTRNSIRTVHRQTPVHPLTDATEGIHLSPESNRSHYTVSIGVVLQLSYCFVLAF